MTELILLAIVVGIVCATYKAGKREGSRKGYGVGRDRARRSRRR